jgi:ribonuclease VapC
MILDTSALIAILRLEKEAPEFARIIESAAKSPAKSPAQPRISAVSYVEAAAVIDGSKDPIASRRFDELIEAAQIAIEPVTEAQAHVARQAYRDFGKTSGHPAKLNFGDCFSYALAKSKGEPLLFKGQDFSRTDVKSAQV